MRATALLLAAAIVLSGCTATSEVVAGTSATVVLPQAFTSLNANTAYGSAVATNSSVAAATNSAFNDYDEQSKLVRDESFGSYELISDHPLVVQYTIREGVRWSDGTPVDAADLLLSWAANSRALNDEDFNPTQYTDHDSGEFTDDLPPDAVYFDGFTGNGLQLVTQTPVIGDDGRSLTLSYDEYFADWQLVFEVGLPAHVVARHALKLKQSNAADSLNNAQRAKDALVDAIESRDRGELAAISRFWNSGFNLGSMPRDKDLLVSNGPYTITEIVSNDHVTLAANPEYRGEHSPAIETIVARFISDPLQAVAALKDGSVDVISPQATPDVASALESVTDATMKRGLSGSWERIDLQLANSRSGQFENPLLREAFLKVVPRQQIVDTLIRPLDPKTELRSSHVFMPGTKGYDKTVSGNGSKAFERVDVPGAKRLLAEAGSVKPIVCVLFDPANPRRVSEFSLIKESAAGAGFKVTDCSSPDWRNLLGTPGAYDAALYALSETNLSVAATEAAFGSKSAVNNYSYFENERVDALLSELAQPATSTERRSIREQIDELIWGEFAGAPLYQFPSITAFGSRISHVSHSPLQATALWNPWRWRPRDGG